MPQHKGAIPWNKGKKGTQKAWNKGMLGYNAGKKNGMFKDGLSYNSGLLRKEKIAGRQRPTVCDVCYKTCVPRFDHCHVFGHFRGWLCNRCNLVLGMVKDDKKLLNNLITYLEKSYDHSRPTDILKTLLK